jgi:hypothetical protein
VAQEQLWPDGEVKSGPTISATELGTYARARFCPRCAWVRLHVKNLPYQSFPGIFSSIDRYNKLIVHNHFDREGHAPPWLAELGDAGQYIDPPHWSSFKTLAISIRIFCLLREAGDECSDCFCVMCVPLAQVLQPSE